MSRNNDVFQVLVTSGNQAVLAKDLGLGSLATGQIGVFDADTQKSVDATGKPRAFYLAVGLANGDVAKSSGSAIQTRNIQFYDNKEYVAGAPMVVNLVNYTADCETEYGVKLELRNQEIYRTQGYNQFYKSFSIVTGCCSGCTPTCPSGDGNEITKLLKAAINNDPSGLVTAVAIARNTLTKLTIDAVTTGVFSGNIAIGGVVSDADLLVLMEYNSLTADPLNWLYTDLQITSVTQAIENFNNINLQYFYPRQTWINVSKIEGFKCNGNVVVVTPPVYEEGSGYDIKQLEYMAKGWGESPYRVSSLNGVADERAYNTVVATHYDQIALTYDQFSIGAWLEYYNNLASIIAIPTADIATSVPLLAILDALVAPLNIPAQS